MSKTSEKIIDDALELPADMRLNLVDRILTSLNLPTRPDIDRQWAEEAERRVAELDEGDAELIPADEVFAKIRGKYKQ